MTILVVSVIGLTLLNMAFALYVVQTSRQDAAREALRLTILVESAMCHLKAKSLEEKVQGDALKANYDMNLERLRDTFAKQQAMEEAKLREGQDTNKVYRTTEGQEIKADDYEVLS